MASGLKRVATEQVATTSNDSTEQIVKKKMRNDNGELGSGASNKWGGKWGENNKKLKAFGKRVLSDTTDVRCGVVGSCVVLRVSNVPDLDENRPRRPSSYIYDSFAVDANGERCVARSVFLNAEEVNSLKT